MQVSAYSTYSTYSKIKLKINSHMLPCMQLHPERLAGLLLMQPAVFTDARGSFHESFNHRRFAACTSIEASFVQDNHSHSVRNVLRGLHYQVHQPQGKLVWVLQGEVFDVAVDVRRSSPTFGQWAGVSLSAANRLQRWIPPGFAHGFLVTSDSADVLYKTTDYWAPEAERTLQWNDPSLNIAWPLPPAADGTPSAPVLSDKDRAGLTLQQLDFFA